MKSDKGFPASMKAVAKLLVLLGASYRVVVPKDVGATLYVDCTLGHFALVCAVIRSELETLAGRKAMRRCGLAGGIFQEFKNEAMIADEFLPKHENVLNGLRLVDGGHAGRATLRDQQEEKEKPADGELLEEEELTLDDLDLGDS